MNLLHDLLRLERLDREFLLRAMYSIPGLDSRKTSETSAGSGGSRAAFLSAGHTEHSLELFMQQQEALARLFDDMNHKVKTSDPEGSLDSHASTETAGTGFGSFPDNTIDVSDLPTERARQAETRRRHMHLIMSAKAIQIISKIPRRLSIAGKMYTEIVGKAITEIQEEEEQSPLPKPK